MPEVIEVINLSKSFSGGTYALNDCNFSCGKGNILALVGESGSGKTTLLRLIAGLETPDSGSIKINGVPMLEKGQIVRPQQRNVGLVFQDFALFPHLTVAENIGFGLAATQRQKVVTDLLQLVRMEDAASARPAALSGGQAQRVAIARALARQPDLLLLDEPFSNLDILLKEELRSEIKKMAATTQTSIIFVTHDLMDAIAIADELIVLDAGRVIQRGPVKDFINTAKHPKVRKMLAALKSGASELLDLMP